MELTTAKKLADLNRRFYDEHAVAFAHRRATPQPGIARVLDQMPPGAHVLEVGCGDGTTARRLAANSNIASYLGLDLSPALLDKARAGLLPPTLPSAEKRGAVEGVVSPSPVGALPDGGGGRGWGYDFVLADLTSPDWPRVLPARPFTCILAFSVFHHLPGFAARARTLQTLAACLAPGGRLAMSNWQFTRSERLRRRIVPWATIGLAESEVEQDDYLLTWERNHRRGLRYVHLLDAAEARRLAENAGLTIAEIFSSDGFSGDLADYVIMRKSE